jgi:TorA maturation chaperone TorD
LLGIERSDKTREPEDHIAILCEIMAGLAQGAFEADFDAQARFFDRHLAPWAARLFADLETNGTAQFYKSVGRVGRTFIELEAEAFKLPH